MIPMCFACHRRYALLLHSLSRWCPKPRLDDDSTRSRLTVCVSQIEDEISALFDFMQHIYGLFGFEFHLELSTRPDNYLGDIETWTEAEAVAPPPHFARAAHTNAAISSN